MPLALIMPVSSDTVSATGCGLSLVTTSASSWVIVVSLRSALPHARPRARSRRVGPDELGDHRAEPLPRVLLQEVARSFDDGMLQARRAGHGLLQDGRHRAGDRVAVAERHQE